MKFIVIGNLTIDLNDISTIQCDGQQIIIGLKDKSHRKVHFDNETEAKKEFVKANSELLGKSKVSAKLL